MTFADTMTKYERQLEAWLDQRKSAFVARRTAKARIEQLKRDALAARLAVVDEKLHLAAVEDRIEALRIAKPRKPERHD